MIDFLEVYFYCIFLKVSICIRVLQRNRTNRMCVGVCVCVCVFIYTEFLLAQGSSVFVLLRPSTDWIRPTHIIETFCFTQLLI